MLLEQKPQAITDLQTVSQVMPQLFGEGGRRGDAPCHQALNLEPKHVRWHRRESDGWQLNLSLDRWDGIPLHGDVTSQKCKVASCNRSLNRRIMREVSKGVASCNSGWRVELSPGGTYLGGYANADEDTAEYLGITLTRDDPACKDTLRPFMNTLTSEKHPSLWHINKPVVEWKRRVDLSVVKKG